MPIRVLIVVPKAVEAAANTAAARAFPASVDPYFSVPLLPTTALEKEPENYSHRVACNVFEDAAEKDLLIAELQAEGVWPQITWLDLEHWDPAQLPERPIETVRALDLEHPRAGV